MMRLSRFEYIAAESVGHACQLLTDHGQDAMLMAGGTDLLVNIKHRVATPRVVIGIGRLLELHDVIQEMNGWTSIGAGCTLKQLENHLHVVRNYPALAYAAHVVSTPQVRTVATIGGNLCLDVRCNYYNQSYEWRKGIGFCMKKESPICRVAPGGDRCWAVASADTVPVLIVLRAEATIVSSSGTRRVPVEQLYIDDGLVPMTLRFGEIVSAIHLPPVGLYQTVYQKFRIRHSFDFPLVGVATSVKLNDAKMVESSRIVLTAVASYPERASTAELILSGQELNQDTISNAGQAIFRIAKPMDNTAGTIFHRKRMARVLFERSLREIAGLEPPIRNSA